MESKPAPGLNPPVYSHIVHFIGSHTCRENTCQSTKVGEDTVSHMAVVCLFFQLCLKSQCPTTESVTGITYRTVQPNLCDSFQGLLIIYTKLARTNLPKRDDTNVHQHGGLPMSRIIMSSATDVRPSRCRKYNYVPPLLFLGYTIGSVTRRFIDQI